MVHREGNHTPSRTSTRPVEHTGWRGVQNNEGLLQLDGEPINISAHRGSDESTGSASRLTKQLPHFYSWRPNPESEATDAFMQNWAPIRGFANPDTSLPYESEKSSSENVSNYTSLENTTMVPISTGTPGGLPSEDSTTTRPGINATGVGVSDAAGSPTINHLVYLYTSWGISS